MDKWIYEVLVSEYSGVILYQGCPIDNWSWISFGVQFLNVDREFIWLVVQEHIKYN